MITKRTVLILGAGASSHLGYPIGENLIDQICQPNNIQNFKEKNSNNFIETDIDNFIVHLSKAQYYSIDEFLENNLKYLDIGKVFITYILKKYESISSLYTPYTRPGWYQYLFNSLFSNSSVDDIKNLNLSIITYNYDRSLECYLHQSIKYRFNLEDDSALEILHQIPIIHIHGILGQYPNVPYEVDGDISKLIEISRDIKIIHELIESDSKLSSGYFCSDEYKKSYALLENSEKIFFLGFGFHEVNMRRFNFFQPEKTKEKEIFATFANLGNSQIKILLLRLSKYGLSNIKYSGHVCNAFFAFETNLD